MTQQNNQANEMPGKSRDFCGVEYYDVTRAAHYIGIHPETLKTEARLNNISHMKLGRDVWFKPEWAREYLEERTEICFFKKEPKDKKKKQ